MFQSLEKDGRVLKKKLITMRARLTKTDTGAGKVSELLRIANTSKSM
jgi:hypothetical protein